MASADPFNLLGGAAAFAPVDPFGLGCRAVPAHPGRLRAVSISHRASGFDGVLVWARRVLSIPKRRWPTRQCHRRHHRSVRAPRRHRARATTSRRRAAGGLDEAGVKAVPWPLLLLSAPAGGGHAPVAFSAVNRFCVARIYIVAWGA